MKEIRKVVQSDIAGLKNVLDSIELFPSEMLDEMMHDYLHNPETQEIWLTTVEDNTPVSLGFCAPEKFTEGTFNLYAIGVRSDCQGKGIGRKMMTYIEDHLKESGHRVLIVETSGAEELRLTRRFYENLNYTKEAVIRDFWQAGEDKVIYWKKLV